MQCRRAGPDDLEELVPLIRAYWEYDGIAFEESAVRRGLVQLLADVALGGAFLVDVDGDRAGYFILTFGFDLEFGGRHAWITDLFLQERHRGRGLGRELFRFIDDMLRREGITMIELVVEHDNVEARAFYEKLGFRAADRVPLARRVP